MPISSDFFRAMRIFSCSHSTCERNNQRLSRTVWNSVAQTWHKNSPSILLLTGAPQWWHEAESSQGTSSFRHVQTSQSVDLVSIPHLLQDIRHLPFLPARPNAAAAFNMSLTPLTRIMLQAKGHSLSNVRSNVFIIFSAVVCTQSASVIRKNPQLVSFSPEVRQVTQLLPEIAEPILRLFGTAPAGLRLQSKYSMEGSQLT